jgi:RHS repeat-associated protein
MIFDGSGNLATMTRHDYLPFGEELFAPAGGRTTAMGYSGGDAVRQQFTQKERDIETGLDYFGARYYSSIHGRFTSVDPYDPVTLGESNDGRNHYILQPQNWNRYTYGSNNPHKYVDPDGKNPLLAALGGAVIGGVIGGGFEAAKALYRGESLTDPKVLRRIGAKALNETVFGAVVGLTGNIAAGSAAASMATAAAGSVAGGIVERAVDGDDSTEVFGVSEIGVDALAGATAGFVSNKVTGLVDDMTYVLRQGTYEAFEQLSGGPFKTLEREGLKRALNAYKYTYNNPGVMGPQRLAGGAARGTFFQVGFLGIRN